MCVSEFVCEFVCLFFARSIPIGREPTNRDAEFLAAAKKEPSDWSGLYWLSNGTFWLVRLTKRSDWSATNQSGRGVLLGCQKGTFRLVGLTKRSDWSRRTRSSSGLSNEAFWLDGQKKHSDWSGIDQSGRGVLNDSQRSFRVERTEWSRERSVLIGRCI